MTTSTLGAPSWVDLATADLADAKRFYTQLFGWTAEVSGDEYGGYTTFLLNGLPVAGAGPLYGEGQPTAWSTYLGTDDADAVAVRVAAAGGKVLKVRLLDGMKRAARNHFEMDRMLRSLRRFVQRGGNQIAVKIMPSSKQH